MSETFAHLRSFFTVIFPVVQVASLLLQTAQVSDDLSVNTTYLMRSLLDARP